MVTIPTRKDTRFKSLLAWFKVKHKNELPKDKYESFILRIVVDLGEVYDENHAEISVMVRKGYRAANSPELAELIRRNDALNTISQNLRKAINVEIN